MVMVWWDEEYLDRLNDLGLNRFKHLMNSNMGSKPVRPEVRLIDGKHIIQEEEMTEDENLPED